MAAFNWATCTLEMARGGSSYSSDQLGAMPARGDATMSFVHEYIHYLQSLGSVAGGRWLSELIECAVLTALLLEGHLPLDEDPSQPVHTVPPFLPIIDMLRKHKNGAAKELRIQRRFRPLYEEGEAIFSIETYPYGAYGGQAAPFEIVKLQVTRDKDFWGYVTARGRFQPFNITFLAENMARALDQRLKNTEGYDGHEWPNTNYETELYNGLRNVLSRDAYSHNVAPKFVSDVVVVLCALALATEQPDASLASMLARIRLPHGLGGLPRTIAHELAAHLGRDLDAGPFNAVIDAVQHGKATAMARVDYVEIFEHLKSLQRVGNTVLSDPSFFIDSDTNWKTVQDWLHRFGLTRVVAADAVVPAVGGVPARTRLSELLEESFRVLT